MFENWIANSADQKECPVAELLECKKMDNIRDGNSCKIGFTCYPLSV